MLLFIVIATLFLFLPMSVVRQKNRNLAVKANTSNPLAIKEPRSNSIFAAATSQEEKLLYTFYFVAALIGAMFCFSQFAMHFPEIGIVEYTITNISK